MATFTPDANFRPGSNQRDWAYHLACLPQTAPIVFTKAGLMDFLKTHGVEVDPNYTELSKVPKYATVGTFDGDFTATTDAAPAAAAASASQPAATTPSTSTSPRTAATTSELKANTAVITPEGDTFRPTRRVREAIGGGSAQILSLFGGDDDGADAPASRKVGNGEADDDKPMTEGAKRRARAEAERAAANGSAAVGEDKENAAKPSTTTAATSGAKDEALAAANKSQAQLAKDQEAAVPAFRPTRRVREAGGTGGSSSITLG